MQRGQRFDIQWEVKICFSCLGHKFQALVCVEPFPNLEALRYWQKSFLAYLSYQSMAKKGIKWELAGQTIQELGKKEAHFAAPEHPSGLVQEIFSDAVQKLMRKVSV